MYDFFCILSLEAFVIQLLAKHENDLITLPED